MIFGIKTDYSPAVIKYMDNLNNNLQTKNMLTNPFTGGVVEIPSELSYITYVVNVEPIYPKFYFIGLVTMLSGAVAYYFHWYVGITLVLFIFTIISFIQYIFYTRHLYLFVLKYFFRQRGYKGKVTVLKDQELLKLLIGG